MPRGCLGGIWGYLGALRLCFLLGTAQVELKSVRVSAHAFLFLTSNRGSVIHSN